MPRPDKGQNNSSDNFPMTVEDMLLENSVYSEWSKLVKNLKNDIGDLQSEAFQGLKIETEILVSKLKPHYTERNDMGNYVPMTKEEYQDIREQYNRCLEFFKDLPQGTENQPLYRKLGTLLTRNSSALNALSPDALPPLADVLVGASVQVEELYETSGDNTIGNKLSSREALEYTDENGQIHRGFFTEDKRVRTRREDFLDIMRPYAREYPEYLPVFARILEKKDTEDWFADAVYSLNHDRDGVENYKGFVRDLLNEQNLLIEISDKLDEVMIKLGRECEQKRNFYSILKVSGIEEGSKIAKRAAAMTDVAIALDRKDLLAGSQRITIKRGDKKVSGVFMEAANLDSVDRTKLTDDNPYYKLEEKEFNKPEVLKSAAELQILDYLCANTDRHRNNFFIRTDNTDPKNPKIVGLQGIDNDNSFGTLTNGGVMQLAKEKNLKVITVDLANKILSMDTSDMERILKPYRFSEKETQAACTRLYLLQSMIRRGEHQKDEKLTFDESGRLVTSENEIRIIRDDEWSMLSLASLSPEKKGERNLFQHIDSNRKEVVNKRKEVEDKKNKGEDLKEQDPKQSQKNNEVDKEQVPQQNQKNNDADEEKKKAQIRYTRSDEETLMKTIRSKIDEEQTFLQKMDRELYDLGATKDKRSTQFKAMYDQLHQVMDEYRSLNTVMAQVKKLGEKEREDLSKSFREVEKKREVFKRSVDAYLRRRHLLSGERLMQRKSHASSLQEFAAKTPDSERIFKQGTALTDKKNAALASKNGYAFSAYQTNQLRDMMKQAMYDHVSSLPATDPKRALGIKALAAQDRLWKFSQTKSATKPVNQEQDQMININQMMEENQNCKDLKAILAYAPEVEDMINKVNAEVEKQMAGKPEIADKLIKPDSLTPKQARRVLGMLFEVESKANKGKVKTNPKQDTKQQVINEKKPAVKEGKLP